MIFLSWNIRGLGARVKRSALRKLINMHDPHFIAIQESKLEEVSSKLIRTVWKGCDIDWIFSPSVGNSGGIISLWSKSYLNVSTSHITRNWVAIHGTLLSGNHECMIINVYNPCTIDARAIVWREISDHIKESNVPCIIMGDFNEVLDVSNRGSQQASYAGMEDFKSFIQEAQVMEVPSINKYTWFRGNSKSKLDRIFVSPEWVSIFPGLKLSLLHRGLSYHFPMLLHSHERNFGPKPFRFQNCWL